MYPAKSRHLSPLLTGFQFTTVGGASVTIDKGSSDFPSAACAAAGKVAATQKHSGIFLRGPIALVTPGPNVGDGGYGTIQTLPGSDIITGQLLDKSAAGDDGTGWIMSMGFGSLDTDRFDVSQTIRATFDDPQFLAFRVTNSGTAAIASGGLLATVARSGTGIVTLTFSPARARIRSVAVTAVNASARAARVTAFDGQSITVKVTDKDGTAQDSDFIVYLLFSGNHEESAEKLDQLRIPQLFPEILAGRITVTAGTPAVAIGGAANGVDWTVAKNGTGDYSVTLTDTYQRAILAIPCALTKRAQLLATPTTNSFRVGVFDNAGSAADESFDFLVVGYQADASQEF